MKFSHYLLGEGLPVKPARYPPANQLSMITQLDGYIHHPAYCGTARRYGRVVNKAVSMSHKFFCNARLHAVLLALEQELTRSFLPAVELLALWSQLNLDNY